MGFAIFKHQPTGALMKHLEYAALQQATVIRDLREALKTVTPVESILVMQYLADAYTLEQKLTYLVTTMKDAS